MAEKNKNLLFSLEDTPVPPLPPGMPMAPVPSKSKTNITINLRNIPLLTQLTSDEMAHVKNNLSIRKYARRDAILQRGESSDNFLLLLSGRVQVVDLTDQGNVIGLSLLSPGSFFGEVPLINQSVHMSTAVALSDVLIAFLPATAALHLFTHAPSVAQKIQYHLAQKVLRDHKFRALLSINNTSKRIISFLIFMKHKNAEKQELVENLPTHQEIANMINTSRETVTRTLLMLAQRGIVKKDAGRLIIINPNALRKLMQA